MPKRSNNDLNETAEPVVSVIIVSDYAACQAAAWHEMRATLAALARQDFDGPAEFILCESAALAAHIPSDLTALLPELQVVLTEASTSYALKNAAVKSARADLIALLDADCVPDSTWLRCLVEAMQSNPEASAISGRAMYAGRGFVERLLGLLDRSYLDPGRAAPTRYIATYNTGFRRSVFLAHPLPEDTLPFAGRLQSEAILRGGGSLLFEPGMRVAHAFEGWRMERDIRRNMGFGTVLTRQRDQALPYAWVARLGFASIPLFVAGKTLDNWWDCIRCSRHYGVRWYELPAALCLSVIVHFMEVPGMIAAVRRRPLKNSVYR